MIQQSPWFADDEYASLIQSSSHYVNSSVHSLELIGNGTRFVCAVDNGLISARTPPKRRMVEDVVNLIFEESGKCFAVSPDGKMWAAADRGVPRLYRFASENPSAVDHPLKTSPLLWQQSEELPGLTSMIFSPDGCHLLAAARRTVVVFSTARRTEYAEIPLPWNVYAITFSPDGTLLAVGGDSKDVVIVDWGARTVVHTILDAHKHWCNAVKWSQDGSLLVTVGINDTNVFRTRDWTLKRPPIPTGRTVSVDVFSGAEAESALILVANEDRKVIVVDAAIGDVVFIHLAERKLTPRSVRFMPNCSDIIYAGNTPFVYGLRWLPPKKILAESQAATLLPHDVVNILAMFVP